MVKVIEQNFDLNKNIALQLLNEHSQDVIGIQSPMVFEKVLSYLTIAKNLGGKEVGVDNQQHNLLLSRLERIMNENPAYQKYAQANQGLFSNRENGIFKDEEEEREYLAERNRVMQELKYQHYQYNVKQIKKMTIEKSESFKEYKTQAVFEREKEEVIRIMSEISELSESFKNKLEEITKNLNQSSLEIGNIRKELENLGNNEDYHYLYNIFKDSKYVIGSKFSGVASNLIYGKDLNKTSENTNKFFINYKDKAANVFTGDLSSKENFSQQFIGKNVSEKEKDRLFHSRRLTIFFSQGGVENSLEQQKRVEGIKNTDTKNETIKDAQEVLKEKLQQSGIDITKIDKDSKIALIYSESDTKNNLDISEKEKGLLQALGVKEKDYENSKKAEIELKKEIDDYVDGVDSEVKNEEETEKQNLPKNKVKM